jgi:hypothetical protein
LRTTTHARQQMKRKKIYDFDDGYLRDEQVEVQAVLVA